jgi:hypothetical protein
MVLALFTYHAVAKKMKIGGQDAEIGRCQGITEDARLPGALLVDFPLGHSMSNQFDTQPILS